MAKKRPMAAPSAAMQAWQRQQDALLRQQRSERRKRMRQSAKLYKAAGVRHRVAPPGRMYLERFGGFVTGGSCSGR